MKKILPFLCYLCLALPALAQGSEKPSTIEITASATVESMPNLVTLSFAVDTDAALANRAVSQNATGMESVLAALRKVADKESKIWTAGFSLSPLYEKRENPQPSGFRASNTVFLKSKALDKVGAFIDAAAEAGVSRIGNLVFTSDKEEDLRREAAVKALRQATHEAEVIARAAGLTVKRVMRIVHDQRAHAPMGIMREAAYAGVQTPIAVGEIAVNAHVSVIFELE
jgi:uncharacterized protein